MATDLKRFTISVTPDMEEKLNEVKKEHYYKTTRNDMIRDLIALGLDSFKERMKAENKNAM